MAGPVYWVGDDGNVYSKGFYGEQGVHNEGRASTPAITDGGYGAYDAKGNYKTAKATRIADPNARGSTPAPGDSNGSGGSGGGGGGGGAAAAPKPDKSRDIALQNAGLSAVDGQRSAGLSAIDRSLGNITGKYNEERDANEGTYTKSSNTNQNNFQSNKQSALSNAANGRMGLYGTLASLGALNGDGLTLANRAVQKGANDDLAGASSNYQTNQDSLDTAIGTFRQQDKERRDMAETAAADARTGVEGDAARSRQSFYSNLANDYAAQGDDAQANDYTARASAEYANTAKTNIPNSNLAYSGVAYTAPALSDALTTGATQVSTSDGTGAGGPTGLPGLTANVKKKLVTA